MRTVCWLICLGANLRFCIELHKGALAFTAPEHCDFAAVQTPKPADGWASFEFSHARFPSFCAKWGRGNRTRSTTGAPSGAFRKKAGTFRPFSRVFAKSLPVFSHTVPTARRLTGGSHRRPPQSTRDGGSSAISALPLQRTPRRRATTTAKNARRREESREDVGRRA